MSPLATFEGEGLQNLKMKLDKQGFINELFEFKSGRYNNLIESGLTA